ncbi:MarC family protein [Oceanidesulfovibrio marinus]|uniref:UPF0056 membrane protein n=1 Tax=Oceanidesulfovibrio marinus TaxID=370038 RepID=A0A6P1ZJN3_9BACT|nr:MarC family protein [Oceanidesulfovibrio marinus]TVM35921.1 MarC family protein [Oceanidesulfovibrio marinus]
MPAFFNIFIKFFVLLTPFFVLTVFLSMTLDDTPARRRQIAVRVTIAVLITTLMLFYFGGVIFDVFGITLDAFRIGAGSLLFLNAVALVSGKAAAPGDQVEGGDMSVVPLAIPITVGPATVGALLIFGAKEQTMGELLVGSGALIAAVLCVGVILYVATAIEKLLGRYGISILTKLTGLILAALSAQITFTGIKGFLG